MLDSSAMEPLYVQLIKQITKDIDEGKYRPGDKVNITVIRDNQTVDVEVELVEPAS